MTDTIRRTGLRSLIAVLGLAPLAAPCEDRSELSILLGEGADAGFEKALQPRRFAFPADHGPHPEYRNEWWYLTGNLDTGSGRRFGYELTIFRFALTPGEPAKDSSWRSNQVFISHFAVTDAAEQNFYVAERYSRAALGLAGATSEPFKVWIEDWAMWNPAADGTPLTAGDTERWRVRAGDEEIGLDLTLVAGGPPILNGIEGLSQKSAAPGNASYYYSVPRWMSEGTIRVGDNSYAVTGLSWLDREWSSSALAADQQGWDWFALQLDDGSNLMFYNLRKADGSQDDYSAGTWMDVDGRTLHLDRNDVQLSVTDFWNSPAGGRYPAGWHLHVPGEELRLTVTPVVADQELFTTVRYWEGAVDVTAERSGVTVGGRGYVELTGYADQLPSQD